MSNHLIILILHKWKKTKQVRNRNNILASIASLWTGLAWLSTRRLWIKISCGSLWIPVANEWHHDMFVGLEAPGKIQSLVWILSLSISLHLCFSLWNSCCAKFFAFLVSSSCVKFLCQVLVSSSCVKFLCQVLVSFLLVAPRDAVRLQEACEGQAQRVLLLRRDSEDENRNGQEQRNTEKHKPRNGNSLLVSLQCFERRKKRRWAQEHACHDVAWQHSGGSTFVSAWRGEFLDPLQKWTDQLEGLLGTLCTNQAESTSMQPRELLSNGRSDTGGHSNREETPKPPKTQMLKPEKKRKRPV